MDLESKKEIIYFDWSIQAVAITAIVSVIILGVVYRVLSDDVILYVKIPLCFFLSFIFILFALRTPINIQITNEHIFINQVFGKKEIEISKIKKIEKFNSELLKKSNRDFGSGGFCGYTGKFSNSTIGKFNLYATETNHLVLIETSQEKIVVSCNEYAKLSNVLNREK